MCSLPRYRTIASVTSSMIYDIALSPIRNWKCRERKVSPVARNRIVRINLSAGLTIFVPMVDCFGVMYGSMNPKIYVKDS